MGVHLVFSEAPLNHHHVLCDADKLMKVISPRPMRKKEVFLLLLQDQCEYARFSSLSPFS